MATDFSKYLNKDFTHYFTALNSISDPHLLYGTLWSKDLISWETADVHPFLRDHSSGLDLSLPKRVFLPLCGNAYELKWFYEQGFETVGVEFVEIPVKKFFKQHNLPYVVKELQGIKVYMTPDKRLQIYVTDIYKVNADMIGKFDVVWDRHAQVAVRSGERERFSKLMKSLCKENFIYFLCTLQFDHIYNDVDRIPIPVPHEISRKMFGDWCNIELIHVNPEYVKENATFERFERSDVAESYLLLTPKN